jgi:hypothetical protein
LVQAVGAASAPFAALRARFARPRGPSGNIRSHNVIPAGVVIAPTAKLVIVLSGTKPSALLARTWKWEAGKADRQASVPLPRYALCIVDAVVADAGLAVSEHWT